MKPGPLRTALRLGRVSNLPTVWTNVMAGLALGGASPTPARVALLGLAASLFYVGGMYLNDAFDHRWDARHRPERPIPSGQVRARTVFAAGFGMLLGGLLVIGVGLPTRAPLCAGLALAGLIVLYDVSHKANPLAPVVMGLCRVALYAMAGLSVAVPPPAALYWGAAALLAYLVLLSTVARKETLHPALPRMVGTLIAGISLLDALILEVAGHPAAAATALGAFVLTRWFQRTIPGT